MVSDASPIHVFLADDSLLIRQRVGALPAAEGMHIAGRRRVQEGQVVFREGDRFHHLYAVRSGTFKSTLTLLDGREQVTGFPMAGELMGLDGVASGQHASNAIALEDAEIWAVARTLQSTTRDTQPK